jgi:Fe-S cluster assembly protein SufB
MSDIKKVDSSNQDEALHNALNSEYKLGFETDVESDTFPIGLDEYVIRDIEDKK